MKKFVSSNQATPSPKNRDVTNNVTRSRNQDRIAQQQVAAKIEERERELAEIDRKVAERKAMLAGLQRQIDRYSLQQRELKVHLDTIEAARVAMAVLAANLEGFGEVIDRDNELRLWRALSQMLKNGAEAIDYFIGDKQKTLLLEVRS